MLELLLGILVIGILSDMIGAWPTVILISVCIICFLAFMWIGNTRTWYYKEYMERKRNKKEGNGL